MADAADAAKALQAMKNASETVRSAIAAAIPVANTQVLTVSVPGTVINVKDYLYDTDKAVRPPLSVRVNEARLVDGMIPLSKFTSGKTGKSVARSYLATLDLMAPVEASVSGAISSSAPVLADGRLKVVRDRYVNAMSVLTSVDDTPGSNGRSKLTTYVDKQTAWAQAVASYSRAQAVALESFKPTGPSPTSEQARKSREDYMQWLQENGRDFKHSIQARYMDWVVHGYKFLIDYNFGIVDVQSGMKRIENSKEAFRNLVLIAPDGASEYNSVALTPSHWATLIDQKIELFDAKHKEPTPSEIRADIKRLKNLLASHEVLRDGINSKAYYPVMSAQNSVDDRKLKAAYAAVYTSLDKENAKILRGMKPAAGAEKAWHDRYDTSKAITNGANGVVKEKDTDFTKGEESTEVYTDKDFFTEPNSPAATSPAADAEKPQDPFSSLSGAQDEWNRESLQRNKTTVRGELKQSGSVALAWIDKKVAELKSEISDLEAKLPDGGKSGLVGGGLQVVDERGVTITDVDRKATPGLLQELPKVEEGKENPWTRVSCKCATSKDVKESSASESASAVSVKGGWGLWSVAGGASHSSSSAKAMSSMSNLSVEIQMECMVVEIDRPWLHAELFSDAELDSGSFNISPGEEALKTLYEQNKHPDAAYQQFSSYPTAFIVAADIELSFSGDTSSLESAVEASSTSANVSVGYGPFAVSASHSQSKSSSKTKMESTATGCKISIRSPQIIGWVQTLLPQLPRDPLAPSRMLGAF